MSMKPALMLVGHGSRDPEGTGEFLRLVEMCRRTDAGRLVEHGFLEFARPTIAEGIARCVEQGAESIVVLPGMLTAAGHAKNDIPSEIHEARARHPLVSFQYGRHLHLHEGILQLTRARIEAAEAAAPGPIERAQTVLLVVGRGSSDPDANADVAKLARILWEGMGLGWAETAFSGVTVPAVPEALARCQRLGFRRLIVFSLFLFTGVLEKRIRQSVADFAGQAGELDCLYAGYLNAHPHLQQVFEDRYDEALHGHPNMNCELCKYRVQLPGFEDDRGQPQMGHHQHVRGIGQHEHR
jgi:sirohydrochlorin ferrochelatase